MHSDTSIERHIQDLKASTALNEAATAFYEELFGDLLSFARRLVGPSEDAPSAVQSAFGKLMTSSRVQQYEKLITRADLARLLCTMVRHGCIDRLRKRRAVACSQLPAIDPDDVNALEVLAGNRATELTPDEMAMYKEEMEACRQLAAEWWHSLRELDQKIVSLWIAGVPKAEIAQIVGRTVRTVYRSIASVPAELELFLRGDA